MKTKIFNILTVISAAYLTFLGCFNLYCKPFEILEHLSFVNIFATISWEILLLAFSVFCIVKLFARHKVLTHIFSSILLALSCLHIVLQIYTYSQIEGYYFNLLLKSDWKLLLSDLFNLIFAITLILVAVNNFKALTNKKVALILSLAICVIGLIANIISTTYFANASLRYTINDLMVTKLQYICFLPTVYLAFKPTMKEDVKNENQVE